jgi:colanic acid biosynthesis glycosyl transferase WcaI
VPDVRTTLRALVVGINYAPEHTGIAPYTAGLCEHLAAGGASVQVFTGVPHYPGWAVAPRDRFRLRRTEHSPGLEVRRLRHHVPARQSALRRAMYELTFAGQVALQRPTERPDVVLAVVPSLLSAVVAGRIARRAGAPLVVWVQDLMGRAAAQSGMDGGSAVAGVVGSVEGRLLRRAEKVLVLNDHFRRYAEGVGVAPERLAVHPNWTHLTSRSGADRAATRARLGWGERETVVLHTGNMGLKQGLENVVDAARLAGRYCPGDVRFVLMGDGSQRAALEAEGAGVAALEFRDPAPGPEYADVLAAADVLLVNERPSNVDMCLPSKLTSYLHAGRPVVAASPLDGGTAAEVRRSGAGVVVAAGVPAALLEAVRRIADDPAAAAAHGAAGRAYAASHLGAGDARDALVGALRAVAAAHGRGAGTRWAEIVGSV